MNQIIAEETEKENGKKSLDQIIREGARRMPAAALEAEVSDFIEKYKNRKDTNSPAGGEKRISSGKKNTDRNRSCHNTAAPDR